MTGKGRAIANFIVSLTDSTGEIRTTRTNPFVFYRFAGAETGNIYVLGAKHKTYNFAPAVLDVSASLAEVNLIAIEP